MPLEICSSTPLRSDPERTDPMSQVIDNKAMQRYELAVDGHTAASYYEVADGVGDVQGRSEEIVFFENLLEFFRPPI